MLPLLIAGAAMMAGSAIANASTQASYKKRRDLFLAGREKEIHDDYWNSLGDANQSAEAQKATTDANKAYQQGVNTVASQINTNNLLDRAKLMESINDVRANTASEIAANGEKLRRQAKQIEQQRLDNLNSEKQQNLLNDSLQANEGWKTVGQVGSMMAGYGAQSALNGSGSSANAASQVQSQVAAGGQPLSTAQLQQMQMFNTNNSFNTQYMQDYFKRFGNQSLYRMSLTDPSYIAKLR